MASEVKYDLSDQTQRLLPRNTLFMVLGCCTASLFVSFFDQTAVTTAIPTLGEAMKDTSMINTWIGSSYLIANTNFQLLYGRFSDIFGRKLVLLFSIGCLIVGNLVSGFSTNPIMLFVFRSLSGLGGGGINCLVMITFSDLLTTRQRGKYFGFVAVSTTLGNGLGPLLGGILVQKTDWRWVFWISCPIGVACGLLLIIFVPFKPIEGDFKSKLKKLDWFGSLTSLTSTIFILVAVSGGGKTWNWNSAIFIVLIVLGSIATVIFVLLEKYYASIPMIPMKLFTSFQRNILFLMCFLMGWAYFVDIYYFPLYLQNIRGWLAITSGLIQLPGTCSSSIFGIIAGFINSKTGKYVQCLYFGGAMWVTGTGIKICFDFHTNIGLLVCLNLIQGLGIGFTFQPTLLSLLANSNDEDRAVVTGIRNFFRSFGGAVGLIITGVIFDSFFKGKLKSIVPEQAEELALDISVISQFSKETKQLILEEYMASYRIIMIVLTSISAAMFLASLLARDKKPEKEDTGSTTVSEEEVLVEGKGT